MADHVGACAATLMPLYELIKAHVLEAERIHGDDTTLPVLAKVKTRTGRIWTYVRDDRPFDGKAPPAAVFFYSRDRAGIHPEQHLAGYAGILQADAYSGFADIASKARKGQPSTFRTSTPSSRWNAQSTAYRPKHAWPCAARTSRCRSGRRHAHVDSNGQAQRYRSPGMACRRVGAHQ
jgi:hypothetical protein